MEKKVLKALWYKIGSQFATKSQLDLELKNKQDTLIAGRGIKIRDNVIINTATEEVVEIWVHSSVENVTVEGLTVNVYYNNESDPSEVLTLDENGRASVEVPHDYIYKLAFPNIAGCEDVPPVIHLSSLPERSIEIEYKEEETALEEVRITVKTRNPNSQSVSPNSTVNVTIDGATTQYTTDSTGVVEITVPIGYYYTVSVPDLEGYITPNSTTFKASRVARGITMLYRYESASGVYIIDNEGHEWLPDDFYEAVSNGTKQNTDATLIEFITQQLTDKGGIFAVSIDMISAASYPSNTSWASSNVAFTSIPANGNDVNQPYYYDGLSASKNIQNEGDQREIGTPAVDRCLELTVETGENTWQGFLGAVGQWSILWDNRYVVDDIIMTTRPNYYGILSDRVANKWTSTQYNRISTCSWETSVVNTTTKTGSQLVFPLFALSA